MNRYFHKHLETFRISNTKDGRFKIEGGYNCRIEGTINMTSMRWQTLIHRGDGLGIHAREYKRAVESFNGQLNDWFVTIFSNKKDAERFIVEYLEPRAVINRMSK